MLSPEDSAHQSFSIGVKALIVQDERVLLLRRADYGVWETPGGRINSGENIGQALKRELKEELLDVNRCAIHEIIYAEMTNFDLPNGNRLMLLFFRVTADLPVILRISPEHNDIRWTSVGQLKALKMQPPLKRAAKLALSATAGGF